MRLQRQLCRIHLVFFLTFKVPCNCTPSLLNHEEHVLREIDQIEPLNLVTQVSDRH